MNRPFEISMTPVMRDGLRKRPEHHKYVHGHALILSGEAGKTGAARLAARGALRIGAGLVTLGCPPNALSECAAQVAAIMLAPVGDQAALEHLLSDKRLNAICVGPGLGVTEETRDQVRTCLATKRSCVLDADALSSHQSKPDVLFEQLHDACVLTPHGGEFARLFRDIAQHLTDNTEGGRTYTKIEATRDAAKRAGCTVLFKGADTVIASPDGKVAVNYAHGPDAAPWLATAGSGDVLSGFVVGLMARGMEAMKAAEAAAWLHVECARAYGPGLIAEDLPEMLGQVFRECGV